MPCIMEGETGVSKTALTRMLFILKNSNVGDANSPENAPGQLTGRAVRSTVKQVLETLTPEQIKVIESRQAVPDEVLVRILQFIANLPGVSAMGQELQLDSVDSYAAHLCSPALSTVLGLRELILSELRAYPNLDCHQIMPLGISAVWALADEASSDEQCQRHLPGLLKWYLISVIAADRLQLSWAFHQLNVHAALTPRDITVDLTPIIERAERLEVLASVLGSERHRSIKMCVFLDEVRLALYL